jgi:ABC-type glycerol-3-phosphate transport system substrate-binding protein
MNRISLAMSVGLAALVLAACGADDTPDAATDVSITGTDGVTFEPASSPYLPARRSP